MPPYHHGDLRNALLETAVELIREQGFEAFTLREVARRAKVSHAAPYRHFRDKADLAAAIAEEGFGLLDAAMERRFHELIAERLPDSAVVSIAHRPAVAGFHTRRLVVEDGRLVEGA